MKKVLALLLSALVFETGAFAAGIHRIDPLPARQTGESNPVVDLMKGLVAFYPFNGNARDESGNNHHGTTHFLTYTTDRLGTPRSAASFNGKYSYMEIPHDEDFDFGKTTSFSIAFWARVNNYPTKGTSIMFHASPIYYIELDATQNQYVQFSVGGESGENILKIENYFIFSYEGWNHITAIVNRDTDSLLLYCNGIKVNELPYSNGENYSLSSDSPLTIGAGNWLQNYFNGDMDEIRIYNRALNDAEIRELFNEGGYANFPLIRTRDIDSVTMNSAISGGEMTSRRDWGSPMGLCWSTSPHPDTNNTKTTNHNSYGSFMFKMTALQPQTRYYVRAYAVNNAGIAYGNELEFTTYPEFGHVGDIDGNEYKTVWIGNYHWMAENLRTTRFNNGADIPNVTDNLEWAALDHAAYSWYKNDEASYKVPHGAYYNKYVVTSSANVCPIGWHIATPKEFSSLPCSQDYSSHPFVYYYSCRELMTKGYWSHATNITGFSAYPSGLRQGLTYYTFKPGGFFNGFKLVAFFWKSNGTYSRFIQDDSYSDQEWYFNPSVYDGYNIRCVEDLRTALYMPSVKAILNESFEIPVSLLELPRNGVIAWQFDLTFDTTKMRYLNCTIENTQSSHGIIQSVVAGDRLTVAWAGDTAVRSEGFIVRLRFRALKRGTTYPVPLNGIVNTDTIRNVFNPNITINPAYGDVNGNGTVQAYDAALTLQYSVGMDPLPVIDPLPWEDWRYKSANVDSMELISAYDASLILQYAVGLIHSFPVQGNELQPPMAGVGVTAEEGYLVFRPTGEVFGLNVTVENGNDFLGGPEMVYPDMLSASTISAGDYTVGMATSNSPEENQTIMKIPIENMQENQVVIEMLINGRPSRVELGLPTGITKDIDGTVEAYPNPARTDLYFRNLKGRACVTVFNFQGSELKSGIITGNHFDISGLENGFYTLRIQEGKNVTILKLLKE
jgi:uncharacterized protein (TIGR02145 family)